MDTQDCGVRPQRDVKHLSLVNLLLCDGISARASDAALSKLVSLMSSFFNDELCFEYGHTRLGSEATF